MKYLLGAGGGGGGGGRERASLHNERAVTCSVSLINHDESAIINLFLHKRKNDRYDYLSAVSPGNESRWWLAHELYTRWCLLRVSVSSPCPSHRSMPRSRRNYCFFLKG